jgi:pimeloyl-ACP methyl ester carboxylesterase
MTTVKLPAVGHLAQFGGRRLWTATAGAGSPAVVFVPGAGSFALDFLLVHELVAEATTSILYDRAGTGWSEDVTLPRSAEDVTDELRAVLQSSGAPAPYLLVGHSLGGLYVQHYAQRFPDEVAALLLLDPAHEDWDLYMPEHLQLAKNQPSGGELPELPESFVTQYRALFAEMFAAFPEPVRALLVDKHFSPERLPTGFREGSNVLALFDELRSGGPRPDVPLIILSGAGIDPSQMLLAGEDQLREQIDGSQRLYDALAAAAPQGEHRTLDEASHVTIPMARPDAVAKAVRDLLHRLRRAGA